MYESKTVRLSNQAKAWIERIKEKKEADLKELLSNGLTENLETLLRTNRQYDLGGITCTINLNVSISSIVDLAYDGTTHLKSEDWDKYATELKKVESNNLQKGTGSTPKLNLKITTFEGLGNRQIEFMNLATYSAAKRSLHLGYLIKLLIYAFMRENKIEI